MSKATDVCLVKEDSVTLDSLPIDSNSHTRKGCKPKILIENDLPYIDEEDDNTEYFKCSNRLEKSQKDPNLQSQNERLVDPNRNESLRSSTITNTLNRTNYCTQKNNVNLTKVINKKICTPNFKLLEYDIACNKTCCGDGTDVQNGSHLECDLKSMGDLECRRNVSKSTSIAAKDRINDQLSQNQENCYFNSYLADLRKSVTPFDICHVVCVNPTGSTPELFSRCYKCGTNSSARRFQRCSFELQTADIIDDCEYELKRRPLTLSRVDNMIGEKNLENNMSVVNFTADLASSLKEGLITTDSTDKQEQSAVAGTCRIQSHCKCNAESIKEVTTVVVSLAKHVTNDLKESKSRIVCDCVTNLDHDGKTYHSELILARDIICCSENENMESDHLHSLYNESVSRAKYNDHTTGWKKIKDINNEDPYIELQIYLDKVKSEINEAFDQQKIQNDRLPNCMMSDINSNNPSFAKQELEYFIEGTNSVKKLNKNANKSKSKIIETVIGLPTVSGFEQTTEKYSLEQHQLDQRVLEQFEAETTHEKATNETSNDLNLWENTILNDLDNLMASNKPTSITIDNNHVICTNNEMSWTRGDILKPEKHSTIPLYSFNIDHQILEPSSAVDSKPPIDYTRKGLLVATISNPANTIYNKNKALLVNSKSPKNSSCNELKIEEDAVVDNREKPKIFQDKNQSQQSTSLAIKDTKQKESTTTEESVLRYVGAVDEDNKSFSSSTADGESVVDSSAKSTTSLHSELENNGSRFTGATFPQNEALGISVGNSYIDKTLLSGDEFDSLDALSMCGTVTLDDNPLSHRNNRPNSVNSNVFNDSEENIILRNKIKTVRSHSIETSQLYENLIDKGFKHARLLCLALSQEPFQNYSYNLRELPSPSSASLHSGSENVVLQELTTKSNSAPILLKNGKQKDDFGGQNNSLRYSRSQSDRYLAEIEAIEACKWLRAAGFPQYAQMYEDLEFPIDLSNVAKDHPILENDPLQSLYRRLCTLNRCATMRVDSVQKQPSQQKDDSDDEGFALSENWTFQPQSRRWSRMGEADLDVPLKQFEDTMEHSSKDCSPDRYEGIENFANNDNPSLPITVETSIDSSVRFRRTGSERLKDGAKALLRKMESIKSRRRKCQNREGLIISSPHVLDLPHINQRISDLKCIDIITISTPPSPSPTSPLNSGFKGPSNNYELMAQEEYPGNFLNLNRLSPKHIPTSPRLAHSVRSSPVPFFSTPIKGKSDDSSSYCSDNQDSSSGIKQNQLRRQPFRSRRFLQRTGKVDDIGAHSDSECHQSLGRMVIYKDCKTSNGEVKVKKLNRGGSLNLGKESNRNRDAFQNRSFRSRTSIRMSHKTSVSDIEAGKPGKISVVRWHSFQDSDQSALVFRKCFSDRSKVQPEGTPFSGMSCGQLQILRKLALVTLTGHMERYCPSHRSGWNWELPKFIKKIKTPDYKDKRVFGVPLLLILQRSGLSLPKAIQAAVKWLRRNAIDQIGLFRKSGVKSRISKLKEQLEATESECTDIFDTYQAYDVADVLKLYFRDLPESLLTTKMSETFVAIYQHLPSDVRGDAIQSAILLLPDENREVLYILLKFLNDVAINSQYNQMTPNNLAVCFAPSIFNNSTIAGRSHSVSPRRRKGTGVPNIAELSETKASHECLAFMISNHEHIFTASREKMLRCKFGYMEESKPLPLDALGEGMQFRNWRGYLYESTSATIKEGREKSRGWIATTSLDPSVEIAYRKVGDDHPLRLWRSITEVEAPPGEVLNYILYKREVWDVNLLQSKRLEKLDDRAETFQYACEGQSITDYYILRSWQPDLPRGACVIVETSIDHGDIPLLLGEGVRGVVLASRYLIEPCGSGRSRVMHLARVDTKGRTTEWYNKSYGHICSHYLLKIRAAFHHDAVGPESKV